MRSPPFRSQAMCQGFSLIETVIVLALVGLILGGIWAAAASVNKTRMVSDVYRATLQIVQLTQKTFRQSVPDSFFIMRIFENDAEWPSDVFKPRANNTQYTDAPWSGTSNPRLQINGMVANSTSGTYTAPAGGAYILVFTDIPAFLCRQLTVRLGMVATSMRLKVFAQLPGAEIDASDGVTDSEAASVCGTAPIHLKMIYEN